MSSPLKTIRIFISSPGDVQEERNKAKAVVDLLRKIFSGRLELQAVIWEELPLQVDMSFQKGIDVVLSETGIDIAVFILWSRLGSPTGPLMVGNDMKEFRSGTEREWQLMLQAREQCQKQGLPLRPAIFVYTRRDEESFEERLRGRSDDEKAKEIAQKRALTSFIREEFKDSDTGVNLRAYHSFNHPTTFAQQLRIHLTEHLEREYGQTVQRLYWDPSEKGPPFRGLDVFEFEHAPIFFGREDEIVAIRSQLREQACRGCAFLLISGPSGSGKSSLARAGVLPDVCAHELDSDIHRWRWLALRPSELGDDMLAGLVQKLTAQEVLPELAAWSEDIEIPCDRKDLREWISKFTLRVKDALKGASGKGSTRLIVLVDQLEEPFSRKSSTAEESQGFFEVIEALARTRLVWVVATVRSDFYQECQKVPALVRMKQGAGHYDLLPPGPNDILRVITRPATIAGLRFEKQGDKSLADLILKEAVGKAELLPLLEHLLFDLYEHRSEDGVLTLERYQKIEGLEGALRKHCEKTYDELSVGSQEAFGVVLSQLVNLSGENLDTAVRRTLPVKTFQEDKAASELVAKLVQARLLSTSVDLDGEALVSVSHEAVLRSWPRVTKWIELNRETLRIRSRLESDESRYREQPDESLLLQRGVRLQEAKKLLETGPELLTPETSEYVRKSIATDDAKTMRQKRNWVLASAFLICAAIGTYWYVQKSARSARVEGLVASLIESDPERLVENIEKLNAEFESAEPLLRKNISAVDSSPDNERRILHSKLALVAKDPSLVEDVTEAYFSKGVGYLLPIRQILGQHGESLIEPMTKRLKDSANKPEQRFRAAIALAEYQKEPSDLVWDENTSNFVAEQLISANPEFQPIYRKCLRPVKSKLLARLVKEFRSDTLDELSDDKTTNLSATNALVDFAGDDPQRLTDYLVDASGPQYEILYQKLKNQKNTFPETISFLSDWVKAVPVDDIDNLDRFFLGRRKASAAITLINLGEKETFVMPVFDWKDDPEAVTQFIFRCKPRGITVEKLLDLLDLVSTDPAGYPEDTRYALLLAIGEYDRSEIPTSRYEAMITRLEDWYSNDPNSGVHGAAGWLLRHLDEKDRADRVDQQMDFYSPNREWFTIAITTEPNDGHDSQSPEIRNKNTKTFYYTFVVFRSGVYQIGSPESLRDEKWKNEKNYFATIPYSFAILDREITIGELAIFNSSFSKSLGDEISIEHPGGLVNWYEAVSFCRWLGEKMGLNEEDQCYSDPKGLDSQQYHRDRNESWAPIKWPIDITKRGFRLPTEAEWEIAARDRSITAYGFSNVSIYLDRFAWYEQDFSANGKLLRPSRRGIFDILGNQKEWTHNLDFDFSDDQNELDLNQNNLARVARGGSFFLDYKYNRPSFREWYKPSHRGRDIGFRLAITIPAFPKPVESMP